MSDEMIPTSPSQWDYQIPYYHHHHQTSSEYTLPFQPNLSASPETAPDIKQPLPRDDQTTIPSNTTSGQIIPSPEIDSSSSSYPKNPRSPKNGVAKPARRRSRASKKAPTTLLNASLTNFRSLVQQYTGCHSSSSHSSMLRNQRGPINLSFGPPPGNDFQTSGDQAWHHEQQQQQPQRQQVMVSYNHNSFLDSSPTYSGVHNDNNSNNGSSKSSNPNTSMLNVDDYDEW